MLLLSETEGSMLRVWRRGLEIRETILLVFKVENTTEMTKLALSCKHAQLSISCRVYMDKTECKKSQGQTTVIMEQDHGKKRTKQ